MLSESFLAPGEAAVMCHSRLNARLQVIAWRWIVERTLGRLMHLHRLARDYETHPHRSEAMIRVAMIDLMSRRLT